LAFGPILEITEDSGSFLDLGPTSYTELYGRIAAGGPAESISFRECGKRYAPVRSPLAWSLFGAPWWPWVSAVTCGRFWPAFH